MSLEVGSGACGISKRACQVTAVAPGLHIPSNSRFVKRKPGAKRSAVFLDRDGVIVRDVHYLIRPSQIDFLPYVSRLADLEDLYHLVVVTNQSGIARNLLTEDDLLAIHSELVSQLAGVGVSVDAFYYCPHLPNAELAAYRMDCDCRKPKPGMLLRAAREYELDLATSYMLGDSRRDVEAGLAAGLAGSYLIGPVNNRTPGVHVADNLAHAVRGILGGAA